MRWRAIARRASRQGWTTTSRSRFDRTSSPPRCWRRRAGATRPGTASSTRTRRRAELVPSEPDWGAEREWFRRRALAKAGLVFGPLVGVVLTVGAVSDHPAYAPGDPRNEPLYWIVTAIVGVAASIVIVVLAVRELRRGRD